MCVRVCVRVLCCGCVTPRCCFAHLQWSQLDETEKRLRAERERQDRIKMGAFESLGRPPPNFNLMLSKPAPPGGHSAAPAPASYAPSEGTSASTETSNHGSSTSLDWRAIVKMKKQQEEQARRQAESEAIQMEESKYTHLPAWKQALLKDKERKRWEAEAPMREAAERERQRQDHFNSLPDWKQKLLLAKGSY